MKRTKIICSIGPVSRNYNTMKSMIQNGMNVARINFSHADETEKRETIELVRQLNKDLNTFVGILFDTKGPDFRTGVVEGDGIELIDGNTIRIVKEDVIGNQERITVNYKDAIDAIEVDNIILLEDGLMKLLVIDKDAEGITCKIINGGILGSRKGVSVPGVKLNIPFISDQDKEDIKYACENDGDFLALSFVSCKEDILEVRKLMAEYGNTTMQIISKIESETAIKNIDEIIENSDGVMVARGDLGVEVPMQQLPILQKMIIKKCREKGKFCIVATEMLASMYKNPRPTRAEVTDIANAVLDGADAVMLSGETTVGKHPVEAVKYMADICENTELYLDYESICEDCQKKDITGTIARSVIDVANILDTKLIVAATMTGYTAKRISTLRPKSYILAGCPTEKVALSLSLNWGVFPTIVNVYNSTDEVVEDAIKKAKEFTNLKSGDIVVITGGFPNNTENKTTNFLKIQEI